MANRGVAREVEQQLVARMKRGDQTALAELMDLYGTAIYRTAVLLMKDIHLAEDASQEAFIKAYQRIHQYTGQGSLYGWLLTITLNQCRTWMRKSAWRRLFYRAVPEETMIPRPTEVDHQGPEQSFLRQELLGQVYQLPYKYREVIILHYYQDLSVHEMSEYLGEREGTVKSKLFRGRALLKTVLEKEEWQDE
jgi:RNA polymerase sigma-70 factor (ECF subfamily)